MKTASSTAAKTPVSKTNVTELNPTARQRKPQARGELTRQKILEAAENLFSVQGYDQTSIAEIAAAAGIGVGTLYHHFADKRSVLLVLVDVAGKHVLLGRDSDDEFEQFLGKDPRQAIFNDLTTKYERLAREGGFFLVMLERAERDPEVQVRYQQSQKISIDRFAALIRYGQETGRMRRGIDAAAAAFVIRNMVQMAASQVFVHGVSDPAPTEILRELSEVICHYLLEEPK